MSSSIFKSICAAAAFGASPTAAQIGNWDILYQSLETDFQDSVTNEITLKYKIGTGRTFDVALFEKNCVGPITGMNITSTTDLTPLITTDLDQLEIMLDLDKSAITSSNIWDGGKLELCVRVQLLSGGAVIKEDKRDIDIAFDFVVDFEADGDAAMQTASMTSGSGQANVDNYVSACKCDDLESFTCNTTPLAPSSILYVCIQSMDSDVEIAFLDKLKLFQENTLGNETLVVVDGLAIQNSEISSLITKNATAVGVATVVPSRFFSYSGISTATVTGIVQVKFVDPSRRLASLGPASESDEFDLDYDANRFSKGMASTRIMRGENSARPESDDGNDESPFKITFGMERKAEEIPHVIPAHHDSSGTIKPIGITYSFLGAVACFVFAFSW
mmetsp:Transcript_7635/g.18947  ORF Transcript_7635/g.18947 Transcript_7635/m.18947 type:complete len:389 (-) Transcript_7635:199-1365(-)|eukprot:CAMPEP_0181076362 /NCGR_PEP_ID=MMETSP1071-20121207/378_1 /TAXON_ID=35127 /ORGANISM="Thalassiosira sp., Strain NH16" /LENGTH=388 /DNA_ID=CAMNT_0023157537 /DNA_START=202 /DNA_END=1368 /DNA_ORIENTATION=+